MHQYDMTSNQGLLPTSIASTKTRGKIGGLECLSGAWIDDNVGSENTMHSNIHYMHSLHAFITR